MAKAKVLLAVAICIFLSVAYLAYKALQKSSPHATFTSTDSDAETTEKNKTATQSSSHGYLAQGERRGVPRSASAYFDAKDLNTLVNTLKDDPGRKAEFALVRAKAIEECIIFAGRPNYALGLVNSSATSCALCSVVQRSARSSR